jgi:peptidoglycan/LPS O-acetylase OafA/YrhL
MQADRLSGELPVLTGLRGIAAFWVFCFHYKALIGFDAVPNNTVTDLMLSVFSYGGQGVFIFFTLSGFLLALPFVKSHKTGLPVDRFKYLLRRVFRVFPTYYAQLAILCLLALSMPGLLPIPSSWQSWLAHATMSFYLPPFNVDAMLGVWWTLPIEFGFYLLLPLVAFGLSRNRAVWFLTICMLVMLVFRFFMLQRYANQGLPMHLYVYALPGSMDCFGLGVFAACVWVYKQDWVSKNRRWIGLLSLSALMASYGVLGFFVMQYWTGHWSMYVVTPLLASGIAGLCLLAMQRLVWLETILGNQVLRFLGDISYSLYLWHLVVILLMLRWADEMPLKNGGIPAFLLASFITIFISYASFRLFERPGIALGKRLTQ